MEPLTYTEEQIPAFLREGRYDAEIAVRLGVTNGDVQRRIDAICRKYGVSGKSALRDPALKEPAWDIPPPVRNDPAAEAVTEKLPGPGLRAILAGSVASVAVVAAVAWLAFPRDETDTATSNSIDPVIAVAKDMRITRLDPDPSSGNIGGSSAGPGIVDGVVPLDMAIDTGIARELPAETDVIFTSAGSTPGPVTRLWRMHRTDRGGVVAEALFEPPPGFDLVDVLSSVDGADIVVEVSTAGDDGRMPVEQHFFRSRDGGTTWAPAGPSRSFARDDPQGARGASLAAFDGADIVLAIDYRRGARYAGLNSGENVTGIGEHAVQWIGSTWARMVPSPSGVGILVGRRAFTFGPSGTFAVEGVKAFEREGLVTAAWAEDGVGFAGFYGLDAKARTIIKTGPETRLTVAGWTGPDTALGVFVQEGNKLPILVYPSSGEVDSLAWPADLPPKEIVAVRTGAKATVMANSAPCLALLSTPSGVPAEAPCLADGTRVLVLGEQQDPDGSAWYSVGIAQSVSLGWVSASGLQFDD